MRRIRPVPGSWSSCRSRRHSLLSARREGQTIKEYMNNSDWGLQAGVGIDVGSITADVRYERINRQLTNPTQQTGMEFNNQQFIVSLGYKLLR